MKYPFLKNILATLLIATQVITISLAQDVLPRPNEKDLVFDYANVLSKKEDVGGYSYVDFCNFANI